jgi:hypothetical protein
VFSDFVVRDQPYQKAVRSRLWQYANIVAIAKERASSLIAIKFD